MRLCAPCASVPRQSRASPAQLSRAQTYGRLLFECHTVESARRSPHAHSPPLARCSTGSCSCGTSSSTETLMSKAKCRSLDPIIVVAFHARRVGMRILPKLDLFIFLQGKQEEWLSKEPAVCRRVQVDATTARQILAASSPGPPQSTARSTGSSPPHCAAPH